MFVLVSVLALTDLEMDLLSDSIATAIQAWFRLFQIVHVYG
jgi:hypothetical protein